MTEISAPVPAQTLALPPSASTTAPAPSPAPVEGDSAPARRPSRLQRLASVIADTHLAAVPF